MEPGKLVHVVYIYTPTLALDARGDTVYTYLDSNPPDHGYMTRAAIQPVLGKELEVARGIFPQVTHKFSMWFNSTIKPLSRIYWYNGAKWVRYEVAPILSPDNMNRELFFYACETSS